LDGYELIKLKKVSLNNPRVS